MAKVIARRMHIPGVPWGRNAFDFPAPLFVIVHFLSIFLFLGLALAVGAHFNHSHTWSRPLLLVLILLILLISLFTRVDVQKTRRSPLSVRLLTSGRILLSPSPSTLPRRGGCYGFGEAKIDLPYCLPVNVVTGAKDERSGTEHSRLT
ncbi:hypothetical protein B0T20DRAFT_481716 [Sordaria brevicollis]|uniref:Uncharacterized protein n=1 Tax=Sordaria brevicollis TaxID=83679 RepID=A0AAE0P8N3_SORBR|nr:hypothetical protein B0T20DRAFT_481716 [Sordaria brevicollis]